ncbi:hypothetical protein [Bacillus cereus]|uniref:hypothetical protein n=1 Tax=Bacillus cereus group TaxID=86661 RepID=UPI0012F84CC7|nr:hypothetical protein [Bacillus cereus]
MLKVRCLRDVEAQKNGTFTSNNTYWGRFSRDGSTMLLSNENQWVNALDVRMTTGIPIIVHFSVIETKYLKNKKELKALTGGLS